MTILTATISGPFLKPDLARWAPSAYIVLDTDGGRARVGGKTIGGKVPVKIDASGHARVTLAQVPQTGLEPDGAQYRLYVKHANGKVESWGFELTADLTWDDIQAFANVPATSSIQAAAEAARDAAAGSATAAATSAANAHTSELNAAASAAAAAGFVAPTYDAAHSWTAQQTFNTTGRALMINTAGQAIKIVHTTDTTAGGPIDLFDTDYTGNGDIFYGIMRGGDPVGHTGPTGGKTVFNAFIPYYFDYDASAGSIYNGSVVQTRTGQIGLTVINQVPNNGSGAAYLCSWGNDYAVEIDSQINGGVPGTNAKGAGGGIKLADYSTASGLAIRKSSVPTSTGDPFAGSLPNAMIHLYGAAGSAIRAMQVYDTSNSSGVGAYGYVLQSDGQASLLRSLRIGNSNQFSQAGSYLHIDQTLGDLGSGSWQAIYSAPTFKPTSDLARAAYAVYGQMTANDANATGNLTGNIAGGRFVALTNNTTQQVSAPRGVSGIIQVNAAGTVGTASAVFGQITSSGATTGTLTEGRVFDAAAPSWAATKTLTTLKGVRIGNQGASGVGSAYGLYIDAQSGAGTKNRSIYVGGGDTEFADGVNMQFGTTTGTSLGGTASQRTGMHGTAIAQETISSPNATDLASTIALVNELKTRIKNKGICA